MLTFKRKLILNKSQQARIDSWIGACRVVYNLGLEIRISAYRNTQKTIHKYELMKQVTQLRKDIEWINDVPADALSKAMDRLDDSYERFFKGAGFPKWANKNKYNSFTCKQCEGLLRVEKDRIKVNKIGWVRMVKDSEILGYIKSITIKKEATGYFICITTDAVKSIQNQDESQILGIDMGVAVFATNSNGGKIENPKHFKRYEQKLRIENRSLARKKKGSNSWKRQCKRLSLLHHKIANVRKDFLHKRSTEISKATHTVILEDLNVKSMSRNKNLSKHILDCGWGMFRTMLEYKTNVVAIDPKFTSQTCNECGTKDSKSRKSQSEFVCTSCGNISNADENAAKNILRKGIPFIRERKAIA